MPFGGSVRTRISSQCLKRHWRTAQDEFAIHSIAGSTAAIRSRNIVERRVIAPLKGTDGISEEVLTAVENAFNVGVYGSSGATERGRQPLLLGLPEVEHLHQRAAAICAEHPGDAKAAGDAAAALFNSRRGEGNNFRALMDSARLPAGLEGALFGRMVTSDPGANIEAAIHVAHAFTVHREESESDYFSVVDDLQGDDEDAGAAHIGDMELTAGLFYGYVVVDVPGLVSNLEGLQFRRLAGRRPGAARQGGGTPGPPHRHRVPWRQVGLHRSLRLRRPDAGRGGPPPAPQPGQRLPHPVKAPARRGHGRTGRLHGQARQRLRHQ